MMESEIEVMPSTYKHSNEEMRGTIGRIGAARGLVKSVTMCFQSAGWGRLSGSVQHHAEALENLLLPVGVDAGRLAHKEAIANMRVWRGKRLTA